MAVSASQKVVFMGLGASGKSSIRSIIFEGKAPQDVADYKATIDYSRSTRSLVGTAFQIFDCGGQESFISNFVGEQAEFIFSNVKILIWVTDVGDFNQVSTSKFYYDQAISKLIEYSPDGIVFCLFHKTDLLQPNMKEQLLENMKQYFVSPKTVKIYYRGTTIFDSSIFQAIGEAMRLLISQSSKAKSLKETVHNYVRDNQELSGIAIYTDDGLPIIEAGDTDKITMLANPWMDNIEHITTDFKTRKLLRSTLETDDYILISQRISDKFFLIGVTERTTPVHYVMVKIDELVITMSELL
ncbi:MAG: ADP-ribosylation factor-like protein [Candidatus Hodarchaeales archaeon]